jgi:CheY-like chemotaxis protein
MQNELIANAEQTEVVANANLASSSQFAILLVEDSEVTQDLLQIFLINRGHTVCTAADGQTALELLLSKSFDFVIIDYHIPKMDGLQVVVEYKTKRPHAKSPKFIGITADIKGLLTDPRNCENLDKVFCKPLNPVQICDELENFQTCDEQVGFLPSSDCVIVEFDTDAVIPDELIHDNVYRIPMSTNGPTIQNKTLSNGEDAEQFEVQKKEKRRTPRLDGLLGGTTLTMPDTSSVVPCQISSISRGGASIVVESRPTIGEKVVVGKTPAWVVRYTENGIAVEFEEPRSRS